MAERSLRVTIVGNSRDLERAFARSSKSAKSFDRQMIAAQVGFKGLRKEAALFGASFLGTAGGGAALAVAFKSSIDAASNLNEQMAKSRQVFGQSSKAIEDWSKTTASSFFIARDEALAAAGTF